MAYPSYIKTRREIFNEIHLETGRLGRRIQARRDEANAGILTRADVLRMKGELAKSIAIFNQPLPTGMAQVAKDELDDQTLEIGAEFPPMVAAATALQSWIHTNFPRDSISGADAVSTSALDGTETVLGFTASQRTAFANQCDTFLAMVILTAP